MKSKNGHQLFVPANPNAASAYKIVDHDIAYVHKTTK